ncbi:unnamed protein product [Musa acuminata subsp. malaccensis]|uniref:(wild Malaysian banana) hypothetical protein n=1 Tax=Musa acuminata subsp. malaccensis TaxID=214687 RepID=A0A804HMH0_MUSAM|nr:unnamed protein product [Musa acuminata subsp. malaccensis]
MLFHINVMRIIRILDSDRRRCINELCTLIQTPGVVIVLVINDSRTIVNT